MVVERLLIRWLYGRMIDTLLATWGLSLLFIGLVTSIFGASTATTISPPLGVIPIGEYTSSAYELLLIGITVALGVAVFLALKMTNLGLVARGTMQNAEMASALGVSTSRIYMITFGVGAAITGLAGGLLAPVTGVLPTIGAVYIARRSSPSSPAGPRSLPAPRRRPCCSAGSTASPRSSPARPSARSPCSSPPSCSCA